jgi:3-oxoacid CoA-transferase B subunit
MQMSEPVHLTREQIAAVVAQRMEPRWIVNLGIGMPTLASSFVTPDMEITLTSENGLVGYSALAPEGLEDPDVVNAGVQYVLLEEGAAIVHHADSFALIRRGMVDVTVLGAYEVATDGSFANWKTQNDGRADLGGMGGAMDLAACAKRVFITMEHLTRDGQPRLVERCSLPITAPRGVKLVVTDIAVISLDDQGFVLEEYAPGWTPGAIQERTGAPLRVSESLRPIAV